LDFYLNYLELIKYRQYLIEKKNLIESQQKSKKSTTVDQKNPESKNFIYLNNKVNIKENKF
jgi:hypothetical protein